MDSTFKIASCIQSAARDVGVPVPSIEDAKNIIGLGLHESMQVLFPTATKTQLSDLVERYKYLFVNEDKTEQKLFDQVVEGLDQLQEKGAFLAIATGKSRVGLDRVLGATTIGHHFVTTRCADETRSKPHPQMLLEILEFTAIDASKAIMVGDTSYDMDMAASANVHGLGVSYGAHDEATLYASNAQTVQHTVADMIAWLLDGRVEKAFF